MIPELQRKKGDEMKHIDSNFFYDTKIPCHMNFLNLRIYYLIPEFEDESAKRKYYNQADEANKEYDQYLHAMKRKINKKLMDFYIGKKRDPEGFHRRLHDYDIKQVIFSGDSLNGRKKLKGYDSVKLIIDGHNDYDYELSFGNVQCFKMEYQRLLDEPNPHNQFFSGIYTIDFSEIGVVEDIPKCNYFSCLTLQGGEFFVAFKKFDYKAIPCKK